MCVALSVFRCLAIIVLLTSQGISVSRIRLPKVEEMAARYEQRTEEATFIGSRSAIQLTG